MTKFRCTTVLKFITVEVLSLGVTRTLYGSLASTVEEALDSIWGICSYVCGVKWKIFEMGVLQIICFSVYDCFNRLIEV